MSYKYRKIKIADKITKDEHRLIMENFLGRKLEFNEVVHHIDGNGKNNSLSNLKIMSRKEHSKLHFNLNPIKTESTKMKLRIANSKVTLEQAIRIKYNSEPVQKLILELNISKFVISRIRNNISWKNI